VNNLLKLLVDGASDAGSLARSITDSGLKSVSEVFHRVTIFGSLSATETTDAVYDETHYPGVREVWWKVAWSLGWLERLASCISNPGETPTTVR
jgi:hypothetical protein